MCQKLFTKYKTRNNTIDKIINQKCDRFELRGYNNSVNQINFKHFYSFLSLKHVHLHRFDK